MFSTIKRLIAIGGAACIFSSCSTRPFNQTRGDASPLDKKRDASSQFINLTNEIIGKSGIPVLEVTWQESQK